MLAVRYSHLCASNARMLIVNRIERLSASLERFLPRISCVGVGGAGGNAINHMITSGLEGVNFVACNTDAQALSLSLSDNRIQLGRGKTRGLGSGANPDVGRESAEAEKDQILNSLKHSHLCFLTAGMGGGTGSGATPVIARMLKEAGVLTVAVVSRPFEFEGRIRQKISQECISELEKHVDTLIVVNNQNLIKMARDGLNSTERGSMTLLESFRKADGVLSQAVHTISELMLRPGLVNLDFNDVRTVLLKGRHNGVLGRAIIGTGEAEGPKRALIAAEQATQNVLIDEMSLDGCRGMLINICGGNDMSMHEVEEAACHLEKYAHQDATIVWGATTDDNLKGRFRVSVVATGLGLTSK